MLVAAVQKYPTIQVYLYPRDVSVTPWGGYRHTKYPKLIGMVGIPYCLCTTYASVPMRLYQWEHSSSPGQRLGRAERGAGRGWGGFYPATKGGTIPPHT